MDTRRYNIKGIDEKVLLLYLGSFLGRYEMNHDYHHFVVPNVNLRIWETPEGGRYLTIMRANPEERRRIEDLIKELAPSPHGY